MDERRQLPTRTEPQAHGHTDRQSYLLLQNQYEDYDRRSMTIKGWVGSGAAAALALALSSLLVRGSSSHRSDERWFRH